MKKSILLVLPLMLGLAACSGGSNLDKGNIITPKFMERNFTVGETVKTGRTYEFDKVTQIGSYTYVGGLGGSAPTDWVVLQDAEGKEGVYSLGQAKFIMAPGEFHQREVKSVNFSGRPVYFLIYSVYDDDSHETETFHVIDEMGNEIVTQSGRADTSVAISARDFKKFEKTDKEHTVVFINGDFEAQYVIYQFDSAIFKKGAYKEFVEAYATVPLLEFTTDFESLEEYGHPELFKVESTHGGSKRIAVYNVKDNKFISSFTVVSNAKTFTVGDYMIFQEENAVEERATNYDLYKAPTKYDLTTTKFNYTTGASEKIETKYYLASGGQKELVDEKGVVKYKYFNDVKVIRDDKALENTARGFILDEKFEVAADVTGINFANMKKFGEYYYDVTTEVVYDGKLNEVNRFINLIADMTTDVAKNAVIYKTREGKQGIMDFSGKVIEAARYLNVSIVDKDDSIFACTDHAEATLKKVSETGEVTNLVTFNMKDVTPVGPSHMDDKCMVIKDKDEVSHTYNLLTGVEFKDFEPASTDSFVTNIDGATAIGQTIRSNTKLYTTAEGALYMVQDRLAETWAEVVFE